jgi:ribonuclease P protein component
VRHRLKRRVREIFRRFEKREAIAALDVVVHLKPSARNSDFSALENELERLLDHVIRHPEASSRRPRSER